VEREKHWRVKFLAQENNFKMALARARTSTTLSEAQRAN